MASVSQTEDKNGSYPSSSGSRLPQVYQRKYRGAPQLGSTIRFSNQRKSCLLSNGNDPEVLDDSDKAFLMNHIRKGTRGTYGTGWHWF